jgi:hypothetical protein
LFGNKPGEEKKSGFGGDVKTEGAPKSTGLFGSLSGSTGAATGFGSGGTTGFGSRTLG